MKRGLLAVQRASAREPVGSDGNWSIDVTGLARFSAEAVGQYPDGRIEILPTGALSFDLDDRAGWSIYLAIAGIDGARMPISARIVYAFAAGVPTEVMYPVNYDPVLVRHVVLGPQMDGSLANEGRRARLSVTVGDGNAWTVSECSIGYQQPF
jgi:hypothetical protein